MSAPAVGMTLGATMGAARTGISLNPAADAAAARRALADELSGSARRSVRRSGLIASGLFVVLLGFATFVPIASGALAYGQLAVEGERKTVQHPSGGIVSAILVAEGDKVEAGDVILRLDPIQASAAAGVVNAQVDALRAEEAVRMAETTGADTVTFPKELLARRADPSVAAVITAETSAFEARRDLATSQALQLDQQLAQIAQSVSATRSERDGQIAQAALLREELAAVRPLMEKGLALKPRVLALERSLEEANGRIASLESEDRRLAAKAMETRTMRARIEVDRRAEAAEALRKLRAEMSGALERQLATSDTLARTDVRAPIAGAVMAVKVTTLGGVVEPGQPLLEIVPQSEQLIARARVTPRVADNVRQGMPATVRLAASGARSIPSIEGVVSSISADALEDARTGEAFFEVRIAISAEEAAKAPADVIAPGLPAEVLIRTGSHTMLDYFFAPVERAMFQSLRDE